MTQPRSERMKVIIRTPGRRRGPLQVQRDVAEIKEQVEDIQIGHSDFATWPPGMRRNPDAPPDFHVTPELKAGLRSFVVEWVKGESEFVTTYEIHVDTTAGFTPADDTLVHERDLSGIPGMIHAHTVLSFPVGHKLEGTAADPVNPETTYFVQIVPANDFGAIPGPYPEASVTPLQLPGQMIEDETIDLATKVAGILPEGNFEGITDPGKLADAIVSAAKLASDTIDDTQFARIIAGEVVAGSHIVGNTILGDRMVANAVTAREAHIENILADSASFNKITTNHLATGSVTADKADISELSAITANLGTITAGSVSGIDVTGNAFFFKHNGTGVGQVFTISGGYALRGTGALDNIQILSDRTAFHFRPDFQLTTQTGKTGLDEYIPIFVNGTARFLRVFE